MSQNCNKLKCLPKHEQINIVKYSEAITMESVNVPENKLYESIESHTSQHACKSECKIRYDSIQSCAMGCQERESLNNNIDIFKNMC